MIKRIISKYNHFPITVKAVIWFTFCNMLVKGINFLASFIFTRMISKEEYGTLSLFTSYEQIIIVLATWEIQLGAYTRGLFKYKEENLKLFTSSMLSITNILTVVFFSISVVLNKIFTSLTGMDLYIILLLGCYVFFQPAYIGWFSRKRINYDYKPAVIATVIFSIINIVFPIIVLQFTERTANVKFASGLIISTVFAVIFWIQSVDYKSLILNKNKVIEYWKFLIGFEAPLIVHSLSVYVLNQADRIMIGNMVGKEETALYSVAYSIAFVVIILQNSLDQVLAPWRYQQLDGKDYKKIGRISNSLLVVYGCVIILFILIAPEIIRLCYPNEYYDGIWCIPPVTTGAFFVFLYSLFVGIETYYEKTKYVLYVSLSCGIINVILNYFGIKHFGYIACAYTTLFSYILFAVGHFFFMKRTLRIEKIQESIYNGKSIIIISLCVILVSIVITMLYPYTIIRYLLFAIICLLIIIKRNQIIGLYKVLKRK
ncbi:MAG: oligosaccharide flippase family protein [Lachnospiraceae bacterium]|nr:oligosaccharide flippase family protein [Lachnospiraceae bacterium]